MKYSIDTSALYDGWKQYPYRIAIFAPVWQVLESMITEGKLIATCEVMGEIQRRDEDLHQWARAHKEMFVPIDHDIQVAVRDILKNHPRLVDTAKNRSMVDPWIIALAKVRQCAVVTHERPSTKAGIIRIPDVCDALGIRWMTILEMIEEQSRS